MQVTKYKWRKVNFLKKSDKWNEYEISVLNNYIKIKNQFDERRIDFNEIRKFRIHKVPPKLYVVKIICKNKKKDFSFNNEYTQTIKKFEYKNSDFNDILKTMHKKMVQNDSIQFISGENKRYLFYKYMNIFFKFTLPAMALLGVGLILKFNNFSFLFIVISFGIFLYVDPFEIKKEGKYNPHHLIKNGIDALKL